MTTVWAHALHPKESKDLHLPDSLHRRDKTTMNRTLLVTLLLPLSMLANPGFAQDSGEADPQKKPMSPVKAAAKAATKETPEEKTPKTPIPKKRTAQDVEELKDDPSIEALRKDIERKKRELFKEEEALKKKVGSGGKWGGKPFVYKDPYKSWSGIGLFRESRKRQFGDLQYWTEKRDRFVAKNQGFLDEDAEKELKGLESKVEKNSEDLGLEDFYWRLGGYQGGSFLRYEYHRNRDFNKHVDDNDQRVPFRTNLGVSLIFPKWGSLTAIGALSRTWGANKARDRPQDHLDLYEGYVDLNLSRTDSYEITGRLGRQALNFTNERVLGDNVFFSFHRSFDAARVNFKSKSLEWDFFLGRPVRRRDLNDRHGNDSDSRESLFGTYLTLLFGNSSLDLYALRKQNTRRFVGEQGPNDPDTTTVLTLGTRLELISSRSDDDDVYGFHGEGIYQRGRVNGDSHESAAFAAYVSYSKLYTALGEEEASALPPSVVHGANQVPWLIVKYGVEWAKGDDNSGDGRSKTFQPVYPSSHLFQGAADVIGFQNVYDFNASISIQRRHSLDANGFSVENLTVGFHHFQRDSNNSNVFDINQNPLVAAPIGRGSHDVGQEIDVYVRLFKYFRVGYSRFYPGRYLRRNGLKDPVDYFYIALGGKD
jgi:hypothetical protein